MKLLDGGVILIILFVLSVIGVGYVASVACKKDDAPIEELCEDIVKQQTGLSIDITPSTPESR